MSMVEKSVETFQSYRRDIGKLTQDTGRGDRQQDKNSNNSS